MTSETRFEWSSQGKDSGEVAGGGMFRELTPPHSSGEGNVPHPEYHHGVSGVR